MEEDYDAIQDEREHQYRHRMQLRMASAKPWDSVPEGFCTTCKSCTTAYNSRGECEVCGTEVIADISEGEKK